MQRHRQKRLLASQLTRFSPAFTQRLLASCDHRLGDIERLRYRTCTAAPRLPDTDDIRIRTRARLLPEYFWEDWLVRFLPRENIKADRLAAALPQLLLIPSGPAPQYRGEANYFLGRLTRGQDTSDALKAICNLADYLDCEGSPIDYQLRRETFTNVDITPLQWKRICFDTDIEAGLGARIIHARRYLFQLLAGADLNRTGHPLSFRDHTDRGNYLDQFTLLLTDNVRTLLHDHATNLLTDAGIDEPLTWSPPATCATGLSLPGDILPGIDPGSLRHRIIEQGQTPRQIADDLGVSINLVRHLLRTTPGSLSPKRRRGRAATEERNRRAAAILTARFFHQERTTAGKTYEAIAEEHDFHLWVVLRHAHRHGFDAVQPGQITIDPEWLREQIQTLNRTNTDIAAELGVSHETIRRHRRRLGLPSHVQGQFADTRRHPELPAEIRNAVEGHPGGWARLKRFHQTTAFKNLSDAAASLNLNPNSLSAQMRRLEHDTETRLFDRATSTQPMHLTDHGRGLLELLKQPHIGQLLEDRTKPRPPRRVRAERAAKLAQLQSEHESSKKPTSTPDNTTDTNPGQS